MFIAFCSALDASKPALKWASDSESGAPFVFPSHDNISNVVGFEVDVVECIAKKLGYEAQFIQNDWDSLIPGLQRKLYDLVVDGMVITPAREAEVAFTIPYFVTHQQLVVRANEKDIKELEDCRGKIVGTLKNSEALSVLNDLTVSEVRCYSNEINAYSDLMNGRIDAALLDAPIALFYAGSNEKLKLVGKPIGKIAYGIVVRKEDHDLVMKLNAAIRDMKANGELKSILSRWKLWNDQMAEYIGDTTPIKEAPVAYMDFVKNMSTHTKSSTWKTKFNRYLDALPSLISAAWMTLGISLTAMVIAIVLGMGLAVMRVYSPRPLSALAAMYIETVRGTPLLIQLLFIFYGFPYLGIKLSPFIAGVMGLAINYSAYEAENYRTGILSVPRGQMEAARALGMTHLQALWHVVIPQAFRFVIPPVTNDFISLLKDSSLVSMITIVELTKAYTQLSTTYYDYLGTGIIVAGIYLLLGLPFVRFARWAEKRLSTENRKGKKIRHII
ncbi:MAG: amino acid ABC transporter permease [Verrucomicrobia bacterium GWC2_42_7]|nr:MAG: amino acid ABC transporter permease [Verrucomicrobia bacterium GWC2_42_7]